MTRLSRCFLALVLFLSTASSVSFAQAKTAAAAPKTAAPAAKADKLDINTASADQLKALKGIGDAYSQRIIAGRPYTAKNQLQTRGIIPEATYNTISDLIIAKAPKK